MKNKKIVFLLILFVLINLNLKGDFWIKKFQGFSAGQIYGQMIYDEKSGNIICFDGYYSVFDLTGKVYCSGRFEFDSIESFQPYHAVKLADSTFLSFGTFWKSGQHIPDGYYIFRTTLEGEILFAKQFKDDLPGYWWTDTGLMLHDNKIKIVYWYKDNDKNKDDYFRILTLSDNGVLLNSKILSLREDNFNIEDSGFSLIPIDSDHYGILANGQFKQGNKWYDGILFLKLNKKDEITKSKWYYDPDWNSNNFPSHGYKNLKIIKVSDEGFCVLAKKENTETICFLKIGTEWNLKWSYEYNLELDDGLILTPGNFIEGGNGYTVGITIEKDSNNMFLSPVIMRINKTGSAVWAKKFFKNGYQYEWLTDIIKLPNGGMALAANHFYILDDTGEVPGGCDIPEKIAVEHSKVTFLSHTPNNNDFRLTNSSLLFENVNASFNRYNTDNADTVCEYVTLQGEAEFIEERSMFAGYFIHQINFTVDPIILPYISKFQIYRKYHSDEDYVYVSEISKEEGKYTYEVEFKPLYSKSYTYKILAVNSENEVVDLVYF